MRFDGGPQQDIGGIPYIIVSNKAIGWEVLAYTWDLWNSKGLQETWDGSLTRYRHCLQISSVEALEEVNSQKATCENRGHRKPLSQWHLEFPNSPYRQENDTDVGKYVEAWLRQVIDGSIDAFCR